MTYSITDVTNQEASNPELESKIAKILDRTAPNAYKEIRTRRLMGRNVTYIILADSNHQINGVSGQYPACVSLLLSEDWELRPQVFGGNGGQCVFRKPTGEKEKYLALGREKVPFRKPKQTETAALAAIERFTTRWRDIVQDIKDRGLFKE